MVFCYILCQWNLLPYFSLFIPYQESTLLTATVKGKGKSHIRTVRWGVPVREDTCPEPSAL